MPGREGFLFLDMNSTDWNYRKAEIIQLSAMKLSNNPPDYDGYACPRGQVEAGPNRKHGLQLRNGRLYRHDNQVVAPGQFHLSEQDLIEEFGNWISRRYDTVHIIYHTAWQWSLLKLKFNRFWDEYDRVRVVPVNFIEVIRKYQGRLGLDDLSLETILNKYGEGVKEDSFENVQGMRMCTVTAARKLHMNPRNFIEQGLDSSDSEGFSDDEDFEAELQAALLLSAEDQGGPPPPSEFSEDTRSPRRQTQYLDSTVDLVSPPIDRQRGLSNTELAMAAAGTAAAVAPRSGGFGRTALVATVGAAAVGLAAVGAMAAVNSFRSSGPPVRGPRSSGGQDWRPSRIREGEGLEDATEETVERRRARLQHAPRRVRITPSNADTPSSDEEDTNSGVLGLPQDGASGGASASAASGGYQECKICFTKIQEFCIIQPCGHASQCYKCARQIYRRDGKCPFCRKNIASIQKIFFN